MDYDSDDYDPLPRMKNLNGENGQLEPGMCAICLAHLTHPIGMPLNARGVSNLWTVIKFSYI